ncbi:MAG: hypothetical protein K0Q87_5555 [Neobacillus sp.]|jgi:hypothetical protein|nr:hypothetical protein [Neobacillus sp.]
MSKVIAVFNVGTNANFKKNLENYKPKGKKNDPSFKMFLDHALRK